MSCAHNLNEAVAAAATKAGFEFTGWNDGTFTFQPDSAVHFENDFAVKKFKLENDVMTRQQAPTHSEF